MPFKRNTWKAFVLLLFLLSSNAVAQERGTFGATFSMTLPYRGNFSVQYFIADRVALDVSVGAIPHFFGFGGGVSIHPLSDNARPYLTVGYGYTLDPSASVIYNPSDAPAADTTYLDRRTTFLYAGAGYNFTTRRGAGDPNFYGVAGASFLLSRRDRYQVGEGPVRTRRAGPRIVLPYLEFGGRYFTSSDSPRGEEKSDQQ